MKKMPTLAREVADPCYAYFGTSSGIRSGLQVVMAGRETCLPGYRVQRSKFAGYGLEFVSQGTGDVVLDGKSFPLFPGVIFCYGPRTAHAISTDGVRPMSKYFVDFYGRDASRLLRLGGLSSGSALQIADVETARFFFDQIIRQDELDREGNRERAGHCLNLLILQAREGTPPGRESSVAACFSRWRAFIDSNFTRLRNLEEIASELSTRPSQICRVFQQLGQPKPFHYLTRKKLNRAMELLVGERLKVREAASAVGYDDPYHFSRLFKSHFGQSPANFRKIARRTFSDDPESAGR